MKPAVLAAVLAPASRQQAINRRIADGMIPHLAAVAHAVAQRRAPWWRWTAYLAAAITHARICAAP